MIVVYVLSDASTSFDGIITRFIIYIINANVRAYIGTWYMLYTRYRVSREVYERARQ